MSILSSKNIILGVCGGVAAYKALELCRLLMKFKANVQVVMSKSALEFIQPLAFQSITGKKVRLNLFDLDAEQAMGHIELARWADYILIAPATANVISKLASGISNDLLLTLCIATRAKIFLAPAMNKIMFENEIIKDNLIKLEKYNFEIIGPAFGEQACGDIGYGRMYEPYQIVNYLEDFVFKNKVHCNFNNKKILITAGPTVEQIDPVRYISNRSSGKMGFYLARAAKSLGASVVLISGPVDTEVKKLIDLNMIDFHEVKSAKEMEEAVFNNLNNTDVFISSAAVVDYKAKRISNQKIKKDKKYLNDYSLSLTINNDIALKVGREKLPKLLSIGFAAETNKEKSEVYAQNKLISKKFDMIFLNDVSDSSIGFDSDVNEVRAIWLENKKFISNILPKCAKRELSYNMLSLIFNKLLL